MKSPATYILLLVFICFAAGVLSVILRPDQLLEGLLRPIPPESSPSATASQVDAQTLTDDGSITILIMGVDHIADPAGELLAVWLLSFTPADKKIDLLGLPLDLQLTEGGPTIQESFNLWDPPEYGASFIHRLGDYAPSPIRGFVALDEHGFAALLDYFGGLDLDDQHLDGSAVIGSLRLTYGHHQAALTLQTRILESLRAQVGVVGTTPELTTLTALSPIHAYTVPSPPELTTLAIPILPLAPEMITISTYPSPGK